MTVKIGAAAWITAVSPESRCVSAKPSSQKGEAAATGEHRQEDEQRQRAEHEAAERDDRRLERLDAELDEEERRSPDRGEEQKEGGIAAGHGA